MCELVKTHSKAFQTSYTQQLHTAAKAVGTLRWFGVNRAGCKRLFYIFQRKAQSWRGMLQYFLGYARYWTKLWCLNKNKKGRKRESAHCSRCGPSITLIFLLRRLASVNAHTYKVCLSFMLWRLALVLSKQQMPVPVAAKENIISNLSAATTHCGLWFAIVLQLSNQLMGVKS